MKSLTKKKTKFWLTAAGSVLVAGALALSGVGLAFKLKKDKKDNTPPVTVVDNLDFAVDTYTGSPSGNKFFSAYAGRDVKTYTIDSASSFMYFVENVNEKHVSYDGFTIYLNKSIDLNGFTLNSIGSKEFPFKGTFDGGYYTIYNANILGNGLFGATDGATIKNLGLYNATINSSNEITGAFVGVAKNTNIENLFVRLKEIKSEAKVGGLVGEYITTEADHYINKTFVDTSINAEEVGGLVHTVNTNDSSENAVTISQSYYTSGSRAVCVADNTEFVMVGDDVVKPESNMDLVHAGFDYSSSYDADTAWCDYAYREGSEELNFNYPILREFVKVYMTGSCYEAVITSGSTSIDVDNLVTAVQEASKTEAEINLIVDKVFLEARAENDTGKAVEINAVKNTTIVRGDNNTDSMFVSTNGSKIVLGQPESEMGALSEDAPKLTLDGNRDYIEANGLESNALVVGYTGTVEIHDNVILKDNINTEVKYGGAVLLYADSEASVVNATIENCHAEYAGGGVAVVGANLVEVGSINNCSTNGEGGAVALLAEMEHEDAIASMGKLYKSKLMASPAAVTSVLVTEPLSISNKSYSGNHAAKGGCFSVSGSGSLTGSSYTISNCYVSSNTADVQGGAIYLSSTTTSTLGAGDITGCYANTTASEKLAQGGAIYIGGSSTLTINSDLDFTNCYATASTVANGQGGAIYNSRAYTNLNITYQSTNYVGFSGCYASGSGGAMYGAATGGYAGYGYTNFTNCYAGISGGAVYSTLECRLQASTSTNSMIFDGCYAGASKTASSSTTGDGGAVYVPNNAVYLYGATFKNCHASRYGGAIYVPQSQLFMYCSATFQNNTAEYYEGQIYGWRIDLSYLNSSASVSFSHTTSGYPALRLGGTGTVYSSKTVSATLSGFSIHKLNIKPNNTYDSLGRLLYSSIVDGTSYFSGFANNSIPSWLSVTNLGSYELSTTAISGYCAVVNPQTGTVSGTTSEYSGSPQDLAGSAITNGMAYYSTSTELNSSNYSTSGSTTIPTATASGTYTVYYFIDGGALYNDKAGRVTSVIETSPTIKITLDAAGGTLGTSEFWYKRNDNAFYSDADCTNQITTITLPTRQGYTFEYFYGDGTCGGDSGEEYISKNSDGTLGTFTSDLCSDITKNATLYAEWTPNIIHITLNGNGGSLGTTQFWFKYGINTYYSNAACTTVLTSIAVPTRSSYTFQHFYGDGTSGGDNLEKYVYGNSGGTVGSFASTLCTDIYQDATLYALWEGSKYQVHFESDNEYLDVDRYSYYQTSYSSVDQQWVGNEFVTKVTMNAGKNGYYVFKVQDLTIGEEYTWSVDIRASESIELDSFGMEYSGMTTVTIDTEWQRLSYTFVTADIGASFCFYRTTSSWTTGQWFEYKNLTLKRTADITADMAEGSRQVGYAGFYGELPTPVRDGYRFEGWQLKRSFSAAGGATISSDGYTATSGAADTTNSLTINRATVTANKTHRLSFYATVASDTAWSYKINNVGETFYIKNGYNSVLWTPTASGRVGLVFVDKNEDIPFTITDLTFSVDGAGITEESKVETASDQILMATWYKSYKINFTGTGYVDGHKLPYTMEYTDYDDLVIPEGYRKYTDFNGWKVYVEDGVETSFTNGAILSGDALNFGTGNYGDITLSMQFTWHTYTVIFDNDGADWIDEITVEIPYNGTLKNAGLTEFPTGAGLKHWSKKSGNSTALKLTTQINDTFAGFNEADRTVTIYAVLYKKTFVFMSDLTVNSNISNVKYGDTITLPTVSIDTRGYTHAGWYNEDGTIKYGDAGTEYTNYDEDASVVRMYARFDSTLNFDANGGTVSPTSKTMTYGEAYGELPTATGRTGYMFGGWHHDISLHDSITISYFTNDGGYRHEPLTKPLTPGATYTVNIASATSTTGATQFSILMWDYENNTYYDWQTGAMGVANQVFTMSSPASVVSNNLRIIIYSAIRGSTASHISTYTGVDIIEHGTEVSSKTIADSEVYGVNRFDVDDYIISGSTIGFSAKYLKAGKTYRVYSEENIGWIKINTSVSATTGSKYEAYPTSRKHFSFRLSSSAYSSLQEEYIWLSFGDNGKPENACSSVEDAITANIRIVEDLSPSLVALWENGVFLAEDWQTQADHELQLSLGGDYSTLIITDNYEYYEELYGEEVYFYQGEIENADGTSVMIGEIYGQSAAVLYYPGKIYAPQDSSYLFSSLRGVTEIIFDNFKTNLATNMNGMFSGCSGFTSLNLSHFNTSNVTDMSYMFQNCSKLTSLDVSNFDTSNVTNMGYMFYSSYGLTSLDVSNFDTSNVTNMSYMFSSCSSLTSLDVSGWDTSNVTNMTYMFYNCKALTSLDVSNWNTAKVTNMSYMFYYCTKLTSLDVSGWDTSSVTNMSYMFYNCLKLTSLDVSNFSTAKVTDMSYMFNNCSKLTSLDVSNFSTAKVTDMRYMFYYCTKLTSLDVSDWDTSKATNMSGMFYHCSGLTSLDVSNFSTAKVTNMSYMFYYCSGLTSLDVSNFSTANVTNMSYMFQYCSSLTSLDVSNFSTANVTNMKYMFNNCSKLTSLDVSNFSTAKVTDMSYMFYNCYKLTSLDVSNFSTAKVTDMRYMFYYCSKLTSLNLSSFNTAKVTNMTYMFEGCTGLTFLDISSFNLSSCTSYTSMLKFGTGNNVMLELRLPSNWGRITSLPISLGTTLYRASDKVRVVNNTNTTSIPSSDANGISNVGAVLKYAHAVGFVSSNSSLGTVSGEFWADRYIDVLHGTVLTVSGNTISDGFLIITATPIEAEGYVTEFNYWGYTDGSRYNGEPIVDQTELVAYFTRSVKVITLTLDNKGAWYVAGTPAVYFTYDVEKYYTDEAMAEADKITSITVPVRPGYAFEGYFTEEGGAGTQYIDIDGSFVSGPSANIGESTTLYASWALWEVELPTTWQDKVYELTNVKASNMLKIELLMADKGSSGYTYKGDLDDGIMVWYDSNKSLQLVSPTQIYAPAKSTSLFANLTNTEIINLENLYTSTATNMSGMFSSDNSLWSLTFGNGWDTSNTQYMSWMFSDCYALTSIDLSKFNTSKVVEMSQMFMLCEKLASLDASKLNTSSVEYMAGIFHGTGLTSLDLSSWDTSKVVDMSGMFYECASLTSINFGANFNTSNVQNMACMFYGVGATSLDLSMFNTSKVTEMAQMFTYSKTETLNVSNFDTSKITDMTEMFAYSNFKTLDLSSFNTSNVTSMYYMFTNNANLTSITFGENFKTSNVKDMWAMFAGCSSLKDLDVSGFNPTLNSTGMMHMFSGCSSLTRLDLSNFNTAYVKDFGNVFYGCTSLEYLDISSFNLSSADEWSNFLCFGEENNIKELRLPSNWGSATRLPISTNSTLMKSSNKVPIVFGNDTTYIYKTDDYGSNVGEILVVAEYTITVTVNNTNYGEVDVPEVKNVPFGTVISVSGNTVNINGTIVTATPKQLYGHTTTFRSWTGWTSWTDGTLTVMGDSTVTANFDRIGNVVKVNVDVDADDVTNDYTTAVYYRFGIYGIYTDEALTNRIQNLVVPTRTGYTFNGYYQEKNGGGALMINEEGRVKTEICMDLIDEQTYYASWTINTYTVSITVNNASLGAVDVTEVENVPYGTEITSSSNTVNINGTIVTATPTDLAGHTTTFSDWTNGSETVTGEMTVIANFVRRANVITITLNSNGATNAGTTKIYYQYDIATYYSDPACTDASKITSITVPEKTGYTFGGYEGELSGGIGFVHIFSNGTISDSLCSFSTEDASMFARWTANTYTVEYKDVFGEGATGGSTASSTHTYDVAKNLTANGFEREYILTYNYNYAGSTNTTATCAYKFVGWSLNNDGAWGNLDYIPDYQDKESVVNLTSINGATVTLYAAWTEGTKITLLAPTREGYTFAGWNRAADGSGNSYEGGRNIAIGADVTLYAIWTASDYSISYTLNGGTATGNPSGYEISDTPITLNDPTREGYTFLGWTGSNGTTPQKGYTIPAGTTGNLSFTANWSSKQVQVNITNPSTWAVSTTGSSSSGLYNVGDVITLKATLNQPNISWWNWYKNNESYSSSAETSYTITVEDVENGSAITFNPSATMGWTHYAHTNFSTSTDGTGGLVSSNYQLGTGAGGFDNWTDVGYAGGNRITSNTVTTGDMYAQAKTGYIFYGWYLRVMPTASNYVDNCIARASDCTYVESSTYGNYYSFKWDLTQTNPADGQVGGGNFYALFLPNTYTIAFDGNGATSGSMSNISPVAYDATQRLTAEDFTRAYTVTYEANEGIVASETDVATYEFAGWKATNFETGATYGETSSLGSTLSANSVLSNQAYVKNLRTTSGVVTMTAQWNTASVTLPTPTRSGYTFAGWYTNSALTTSAGAAGASFTPSADTTLYAKWTADSYTVTLNGNGGNVGTVTAGNNATVSGSVVTTSFDKEATFTTTPTRTGYTFIGWNQVNGWVQGALADSNGEPSTSGIRLRSDYLAISAGKTYYLNVTTNTGETVYIRKIAQYKADKSYINMTSINGATGTLTTNSEAAYIRFVMMIKGSPSMTMADFSRFGLSISLANNSLLKNGTITNGTSTTSVKNMATSGNVNLYAQWAPNTYTIAYNGNNSTSGSTASSSHTYDVAKRLTANGFARTGYTFAGWNTAANGSGTSYENEASVKNLSATQGATVTLYAQWKANTYTVTFDKNSGDSVSKASMTVTYDSAYGTLPTATKTGYAFASWNTKADGSGTTITADSKVTTASAHTLYAQYTAGEVNYTVKHWQQNVACSDYVEVTLDSETLAGLTEALTEAEARTYEGFTAQAITQQTIAGDGSTVVNVYYNRNSYTVTLEKGTGISEVSGAGSYIYGATASVGATASEGYTFAGTWTGDVTVTNNKFTMPAQNVTLTAQAVAIEYYVSYDGNGSTSGSMSKSTHIYDTAKALTANAFAKTGYTFKGWSLTVNPAVDAEIDYADGASVKNLTSTEGATVNLYAVWAPNTSTKYTVYHYLENIDVTGTLTTSNSTLKDTDNLTGTTGANVTPAVKTYEGFTAPSTQTVAILADGSLKVYYFYTRNSHVLTLTKGTGIIAVTGAGTHDYGKTVAIDATVGAGYTWSSWTRSGTEPLTFVAETKSQNIVMGDGDVTLTATTTVNGYTVTFDANGGTPATQVVEQTFNTNYVLPATEPTRTGYTFAGWYTAAIDGTKVTSTTKVTTPSNHTLYAQWTAINTTISTSATSVSETYGYKNAINVATITAAGGGDKWTYSLTSDASNYFVLSPTGETTGTAALTFKAGANAGTYTATVTATSAFNGTSATTETITVVINKAENPVVVTANTGLVYNGSAHTLVTTTNAQGLMYYKVDQDLDAFVWYSEPEFTDAGEYKVYWICEGNENYNSAEGEVVVTIAKADFDLAADWTYNYETMGTLLIRAAQTSDCELTLYRGTTEVASTTVTAGGIAGRWDVANYMRLATGSYTVKVVATPRSSNYNTQTVTSEALSSHTLTLEKGEGIYQVIGAGTYIYGEGISILATLQDGYSWERWTKTSGTDLLDFNSTLIEQTVYMGAGDATLKANAKINRFSFEIEGDEGIESVSHTLVGGSSQDEYDFDSKIQITAVLKTGYSWLGWVSQNSTDVEFDASKQTQEITMPNGAVHLKATTLALPTDQKAEPTSTTLVYGYAEQVVSTLTASGGGGKWTYTLSDDTNFSIAPTGETTGTAALTFKAGAEVGTYTVKVTATSAYNGTSAFNTITVTVTQAVVTVPSTPADKAYTGAEQASGITAPENTSIVAGSSTEKATDVGTYNMVLALANTNYKWNDGTTSDKTITWKIVARSITADMITLNPTSYTYDGSAKTPSVTVKIGNVVIDSSNYEIAYKNNTAAGTATVTVTGKANLKDSANKTFTINAASVTVPSSPTDKVYTGASQASGITAPANASIVTASSVTSATDVGTYSVVLALNSSNYQWSDGTTANKTVTWKIVAKAVTSDMITLNPTTFTYDGNAKTPTVIVKIGNVEISNSNYTVTYTNNIEAGKSATVTVTGKNNLKDSASKNFTIEKAGMSVEANWSTTIGTISITANQAATYELTLLRGAAEVATKSITTAATSANWDVASELRKVAGSYTVKVVATPANTSYDPAEATSASLSSYVLTLTAGTGISAVSGAGTYIYGEGIAIDATVKEGYTWQAWAKTSGTDLNTFATSSKAQTVKLGSGAATLEARATVNTYTIKYNLDGGSETTNPTSYTVESENITLNAPTREDGYTFLGWTGTDITGMSKDVTIAKGSIGNREYTAIWAAKITVTATSGKTYKVQVYEGSTLEGEYSADFSLQTRKTYTIKVELSNLVANSTTNTYEIVRASITNGDTKTVDSYSATAHTVTILNNVEITALQSISIEHLEAYKLAVTTPANTIAGFAMKEVNAGNDVIVAYGSNYIIANETVVEFTIDSAPVSLKSPYTYIGFKYNAGQGEEVVDEDGDEYVTNQADKFVMNGTLGDRNIGVRTFKVAAGTKLMSLELLVVQSVSIDITNRVITSGTVELTDTATGFTKVVDVSTTRIILYAGTWTITDNTANLSIDQLKQLFEDYEVSADGKTVKIG